MTERSFLSDFTNSRVFRALRMVVFIIGVATIHMFWFSFIALSIGIALFLLSGSPAWKRHGIVLSICTGTSTYAAHVLLFRSPLQLAFFFGTIPYVGYLLAFMVWTVFLGKRDRFSQWSARMNTAAKNMPRWATIIAMLLLVLAPVTVWSSFYIDLGVMFDNRPQLLWVNAPSTVNIGSEFQFAVEAWDAYERLSAIYQGTVQFSIVSYNLTDYEPISSVSSNLPDSYTFSGQLFGSDIAYEIGDGKDNGMHVFTASIDTPGVHYLLVDDSVTENTYYSNPIIARDLQDNDLRIYWGDLHTHSELSDGTGTAEHSFYYGRHIARLDFMVLTDHGEIMMWNPWAIDTLESAANTAYDPGNFVIFQGTEWTDVVTGHYTCIFSGDQLPKDPILSYLSLPTPETLWSALDDFTEATGCSALALPHHSTQLAYIQDWTYMNPKYVKMAEVTSVHGAFLFEQRHPLNYVGAIDPPPEYLNGSSIVDAFRMGYRMTLYASSDEHDGHPGHSLSHTPAFVGHQRPWTMWHTRNEHPYPGGLVAVHAYNLTRSSIFLGLDNQRIFANSDHGRPIIDFSINSTQIGDGSTLFVGNEFVHREINVFLAQDGTPVATLHQAAAATSDWSPDWSATVEILKNGELLAQISISSPVVSLTFIDDAPITGTEYGVEGCVQRDGQYFINDYSDNPINPATLDTEGADFYIIRVVGNNGRITYAGPI
ncbi:MAG: DUF3604 domain-containing protein, partial [Candidatus Thorarchaeota archaeon]